MAERSPLFLGLVRPPKLLGLPIMYAMIWLFGSVLLFVWVQHLVVLGIAAVLYPVLWKAADWDPRFIDVMMTSLQETPPTRTCTNAFSNGLRTAATAGSSARALRTPSPSMAMSWGLT